MADSPDTVTAGINRRFDQIDAGLTEIHRRIDRLQRTMMSGMAAMTAAILAGNIAMAILIVTRT